MPATDIPFQTMLRSGIIPSVVTSDEANGNSIKNFTGDLFVRMENTDASTRTVTFSADRADNDGNTIDNVVALLASEIRYIGPFKDRSRWGGGDHLLQISYSASTSTNINIEAFLYPFQQTEAATK